MIHLQIKKTKVLNCFLLLIKAKSHELFYIWVTKLQVHRLFKKNEAAHVHSSFLQTLSHSTVAEQAQRNGDLVTIVTINSNQKQQSLQATERESQISSCVPFPSVIMLAELCSIGRFRCSIRSAALS